MSKVFDIGGSPPGPWLGEFFSFLGGALGDVYGGALERDIFFAHISTKLQGQTNGMLGDQFLSQFCKCVNVLQTNR
jgi:hypothetical protein